MCLYNISLITATRVNEDGTIESEGEDSECDETVGEACSTGISYGVTASTKPGNIVTSITTATATISTCASVTECNPKDTHTTSMTTSVDACEATEEALRIKGRAPSACKLPAVIYPKDPWNTVELRKKLDELKGKATDADPFDWKVLEAPAARHPRQDIVGFSAVFWVSGITAAQKRDLKRNRGVS